MSRKGPTPQRVVLPDPVYNSELVQRFINRLMVDGKKVTAEKIFYNALEVAAKKAEKDPLEVFESALRNVSPTMQVRPRRVGGQTYQVPMEVKPERRRTLAIRWLVTCARKRAGKTMIERLSSELFEAANEAGSAYKKREEAHRMAESNRAFSHYRF